MGYIGNAPYQGVVDSGNIVDGSIQSVDIANSAITSSKLASEVTTLISQGGGPKITNIQVTNNTYTVLDDTAVDTAGGYIRITGTGFAAGCQVLVNNVPATSTTFVSATEVRAQVPGTAAGTYVVYLVNSDGGVAIRVNGVTFSTVPSWTTTSSLNSSVIVNIQLQASGASTFSLATGSTLPAGLTLNSSGLLSGTIAGLTQDTTYSFTVNAIDTENQDSPRTFSLAVTITVPDPYYELVTLHLPGNGTNLKNNNEFLDSSSNAFTVTRNPLTGPNAPTQGTFSPFSQTGWGNYFGAASTKIATTSMTQLGSDFTLELWVYPQSFADYNTIFDNRTSDGDASGFVLGLTSAAKVYFYSNGSFLLTTTGTISANTWTHIALVRSGSGSGNVKIYINGVADVTTATYTTSFTRTAPSIGDDWNNRSSLQYYGYLSNLRATTGALYTSNFTPSTTPLTTSVSTGTVVLLTCQSNRFRDASASPLTITATGSPSVQAFSPFNPTSSWSAVTNGGSGYFDGNGDYLTVANSAALSYGTGSFTIEGWFYTAATGQYASIFSDETLIGTAGLTLLLNPTAGNGQLVLYGNGVLLVTATNKYNDNAWHHFAISRDSTNLRLYVDGAYIGNSASGSTNFDASQPLYLMSSVIAGRTMAGYLSSFRTLKGTALYTGTGTITVPTAPLTNITNTSLLLNFTNAGIYDATSKNDLETVGNAQISTAQSKWGGSSIYFDGSGDYLTQPSTAPSSELFRFGTGDFTFEAWVRFASVGNTTLVTMNTTSGFYWQYISSNLAFGRAGGGTNVNGSWSPSANVWYHVATVRSGNTVTHYIDGTSTGSGSFTDNISAITTLQIASGVTGSLNGYLQDLRITKYARYTANFTAPTAAFPTL